VPKEWGVAHSTEAYRDKRYHSHTESWQRCAPLPVQVECPESGRLVQEFRKDPAAHRTPQHASRGVPQPQRPQSIQQAAVKPEIGCDTWACSDRENEGAG